MQSHDYLLSMKTSVSIVWFKRDLRVHDHAALSAARADGLPTLPLFVIEPDYWQQPTASRRHWHFIHDSLIELREDCAFLGQPLVVRTDPIIDVFNTIRDDHIIKGTVSYTHLTLPTKSLV